MSTPPPAPGRRVACVDVPALPLQLVLRAHPEWRAEPVVVVEDDRPQARVTWANRAAREARIRRGQRHQEAEALTPRLHAAVVSADELAQANAELLRIVFAFSPAVEPVAEQPGTFVVDASGLHELFTGLEAWAQALHRALESRGFVAGVAVGFARFSCGALARARAGWLVTTSPAHEHELAATVPFAALDAPRKLREQMAALGVRTLGEFLALPAAGLGRRFGKEARQLRERVAATWTPIVPVIPGEPVRFGVDFEIATADLERVLAELAAGLQLAFARLAARREAVTALQLELVLERADRRCERLATAAPTLDVPQLLELVRLRLAAVQLAGPVERFTAELASVAVTQRQLALLAAVQRRDLAAGERALARLAASFGDHAVTRARLVAAHLPERSFTWEPLRTLRTPQPAAVAAAARPLVRTWLATPAPLGTMPVHEPEAWLDEFGAVRRAHGPFRVSHGWWHERIERDYFFLETDRGAILWVFHDRRARRWYLQGRVD
jgi:protein ImuB